ncbi:regulatory helix-turn-helix protein, lysR family [Saccharopolyspora antimicrobica]|uniref:Regulatory helix-turn-helix LysR family protein n=1 Tax=Saccharopolyspora antimicrobica TaxID=455193 RepID=A0A1I4XMQ4_9PSEU|nr:TniQ family protein [Saccharopolyspora antimicrobica]RKT84576.1 regulatory helix-turn-helix LysR family protein [Saccharopolyspora antimicrobica]SFN27082.1 regulatory helix-turn-helix protein, lysR family [Saccharopolyspora antimicrobica]
MTMRTLPLRVAPVPGEALDSWLAALAYRLHTPLGDLLPEIAPVDGREPTKPHLHIPTEWTVLLRPAELAMLATVTGTDPAMLEAMTLAHYDGHAVIIDTATRRVQRWRLWGRKSGSRYCPDCLAETGGRWQLTWRLGWSFACTRHHRLLADTCPDCGRVPRRRLLQDLTAPGHCVQPASSHEVGRNAARCGSDLTQTTTTRFPADHPLLRAQRAILAAIADGIATFGVYADEPQPAISALSDLRALAARILNTERDILPDIPKDLLAVYNQARNLDSGHHRPAYAQHRPGFMAPAHAAVAALGATAGFTILDADTIQDAGNRIRWLVESTRERGAAASPTTIGNWGKGTSSRLKAVQISGLGPLLKPSDQVRHRIAAATPCHRLPVAGSPPRQHRVPSLIWTEWALRLQPDQGFYLHTLRSGLSTVLLLAGTKHILPDAARLLGAHALDATRVLQTLTATGHWPHVLTALTRLSDYLDEADVPIDYHRRRRLIYDNILTEDRWRETCRNTGTPVHHGRRFHFARRLLFETTSGLRPDQAPVSFAPCPSENPAAYVRFTTELTPELAAGLEELALEFLTRHDIHDEPVGWQPPLDLIRGLTLPGHDPGQVDLQALHQQVRGNRRSLAEAAESLGTTLDVARFLLGKHPAPRQLRTEKQVHATGGRSLEARTALPKDRLVELYCEQRRSLREIAAQFGVSRGVIRVLLDDYGITPREAQPEPKIMVSRDWLYDQYVYHRRTLPDLAQETGMSTANMARWAKTHDIPLRSRGGASHDQIRRTQQEAAAAPEILRPALVGHGAWERLERFAAASSYRTITEAARTLGLRQSPLTTQINRLEHDLGGSLLERAERGRPMRLTQLGRDVVAAVRRHREPAS